jgi:hypothetical protein
MSPRVIRTLAAAFSLSLWLLAGCDGGNEENLSTKSSSDPDRLQKAQTEAQDAAAKAKAAEAKKTKGRLKVEEP